MSVLNILWRNMKWRFQNPITIVMTILQPLIWLVLYSTIAGQTMTDLKVGNYTAFILPGILVLVIFSSSCGGGIVNYIMKTGGSFYRIQISPIRRSYIVLGHILESVLLSFMEVTILFVLSLFLSVRIASGLNGFLIMITLIFLTSFFMAGITYSLSLFLPNEAVFETMMTTIVLPIFFVSTALFPLDRISGAFRIAVMLNPFTHIINCLRSLLFESYIDWNNILFAGGLFLVLCFLSFILAIWSLQKDAKQ